ncbi:MAG: hypothetical protein ACRDSR_08085 [Pseudonocardiaceae bacterium]
MNPTVSHTGNQHICEVLRGILHDGAQAGPGVAGRIGSIPYQAVAALYTLLINHPIDRRGRCRSCRRPCAVFGFRRRHCRIHGEAQVWFGQPEWFLRSP